MKKIEDEKDVWEESSIMNPNQMAVQAILETFKKAGLRMTQLLRQSETDRKEEGYYVLTTWPTMLIELATKWLDQEDRDKECDDDDLFKRAFPIVKYITMKKHKEELVESVRYANPKDHLLFQMYDGDCMLHNLVETTTQYNDELANPDEPYHYVFVFLLMYNDPRELGPAHLDDIMSSYFYVSDDVLKILKKKHAEKKDKDE